MTKSICCRELIKVHEFKTCLLGHSLHAIYLVIMTLSSRDFTILTFARKVPHRLTCLVRVDKALFGNKNHAKVSIGNIYPQELPTFLPKFSSKADQKPLQSIILGLIKPCSTTSTHDRFPYPPKIPVSKHCQSIDRQHLPIYPKIFPVPSQSQ